MKVQNEQRSDLINKNRKSEEFIFNEDVEKHIGKYSLFLFRHTGKYFARIRSKTHFDGFPRFSEYLSQSETDENSLAKDNETDSINDISNQFSLPSVEKESEKIETEEIKTVKKEESNPRSISTEYLEPGFGENNISSIKRKSNSLRPSEVKNLKEILMVMDELKEFEFDENLFIPSSIHQSDSNEINNNEHEVLKTTQNTNSNQQKFINNLPNEHLVHKPQQNRKSLLRKSPEKKNGVELKKEKRKSRVSFKQSVIFDGFESENPKESEEVSNNEKEEKIEENQMLLSEVRMSRVLPKQEESDENSKIFFPKKIAKIKEEDTFVFLEETENIEEKKEKEQNEFNDDHYEPEEYDHFEYVEKIEDKKEEINEVKLNKRQMKAKKEQRIIDEPKKDVPEVKLKKKKANSSKPKQQTKRKIFENQSNKLYHRENEEISESKNEENNNSLSSQSQRYPKRTRIRPVSYWENEKVHYKAGIAIGIDRATLNLTDLLQTNQANFEHFFNVSLHSNEIEIEIIIPAKKEFCSKGFKPPYETLIISISEKSKYIGEFEIEFEDGIRCEPIEENTKIEVPQAKEFEIKNKSFDSIFIRMKLI